MDKDYAIRKIDDKIGKGLFALRDFGEGEIIFCEKPLVSCQFSWNKNYKYSCCNHCFEPLETVQENLNRFLGHENMVLPFPELCSSRPSYHVSCSSCNEKYCSEECRKLAKDSYHEILCYNTNDIGHPLVNLELIWKYNNYPPETFTILLLVRVLACILQSSEPELFKAQLREFMQELSMEEDSSIKLFDNSLDIIEELRVEASSYFGSYDILSEYLTPEGFIALLALFNRNSQGIGTSAIARWVSNISQEKEITEFIDKMYDELETTVGLEFLNNEGSGLYTLQSSINHSCDPNSSVEFPFNNYELSLKALRSITKGEEIRISYLNDCCSLKSNRRRRSILLQSYLFSCECRLCLASSENTSEEDMSEDSSS